MRILSRILSMLGGRGRASTRRPAGVGASRMRTSTRSTAGGGIGSMLRRFLR